MLRGVRKWYCKWVPHVFISLKRLTTILGATRTLLLFLIRNYNNWSRGSWMLRNVQHAIGHSESEVEAAVKNAVLQVLGLLQAMYILSTSVYYMRADTGLQNLPPHHLHVDGSCSLSRPKGTPRQAQGIPLMRATHQHHLLRQVASQQRLLVQDTLKDAMS